MPARAAQARSGRDPRIDDALLQTEGTRRAGVPFGYGDGDGHGCAKERLEVFPVVANALEARRW